MRKCLSIVSVWNFRSVLMRLRRILIKIFTNILLGLRENFEKILGGFRVYSAKIIFRTPDGNFEKVLSNVKNFRVISKNFWLNFENNEKNLGEIRRFFPEIVKWLGKFIRCPWEFWKILKILRGTLRKIFKKQKVSFEEIFSIKKCIKSKLIRNFPFAPKRASLLHLPITSYLSLVYIRATARAIREETIFVDASSGRLPIYT